MKNLSTYFDLDSDLIYVNHAAVTPWPQATVAAVKKFADENGRLGSRHYNQWIAVETELRQRLAQLINAPSADSIALLKNTSEGLSVIAYGLEWQSGDNIVIAEEEFPSNRIVWESLKSQGVEIKLVSLKATDNPEQSLIDAMDPHTRLLSVSAVQYASGLRMDLKQLGQACKQRNVLYCVDAIQQIGALRFDVQDIDADFAVADGHKWMLGPEGLALFYCRQSLISTLKLNQYGWHMVENMNDYANMDQWQPAASARRFEAGSPNMLAAHALHASVGVLLEIGMETIERAVMAKIDYLIKACAHHPDIHVISPVTAERHAGIFTFYKDNRDMDTMYQWLVDNGVVCALRGGGIRFSPHFYTSETDLEQLIEWITSY